MRDHIHTVVGRYKGKIKVWDVVNEAVADGGTNILRNSLWLQIIGPDFIAKAFEYAHEADPDAILRYGIQACAGSAIRQAMTRSPRCWSGIRNRAFMEHTVFSTCGTSRPEIPCGISSK